MKRLFRVTCVLTLLLVLATGCVVSPVPDECVGACPSSGPCTLDDGCGYLCFACDGADYCASDGYCYCSPSCPSSGPCDLSDGCGDPCFVCDPGYYCAADGYCYR